jgi:hypothetical protein
MALPWKLVFDANDANRLADFWAAALEYEVEDLTPLITRLLDQKLITEDLLTEHNGRRTWRDYAGIRHPDDPVDAGTGMGLERRMLFQHVPEGKTAKNRVHLDIHYAFGDPEKLTALVERLTGIGATAVREVDEGPAGRWWIMLDPEGNEFCAT